MSAPMTGGEVLVRSLAAHGVDTVFGIPGTHNLEIYRHLPGNGIRHITPRHEQGAGYAADGYARTTGRPGVALTTTGPALLNIAAAVGQAWSDSVPLLVVSPGVPVRHPQRGNGLLHEARDQRAALAAVARLAHRVTTHAELTEAVAQIFAEFAAERPRPVHLEIPLDLLGEVAEVELAAPLAVRRPQPDPTLVRAAAKALATATRPLILAGGGARGASAPLTALAEALGAPVLTTINGKGTLPEDHPLSVGAALHLPAASECVADADVLLAVGTELAATDWWSGPPTVTGTLIRVDIEPAALLTNARPDIAIHGDAAPFLAALVADQGHMAKISTDLASHSSLIDARRARTWRARLGHQARTEAARWLSALDAIASTLDRDAIVAADNAMGCYYGALGSLPSRTPGGFLFPTGFGTLGYAVPAAFGAAVAHPGRQVLALVGDGGLMFSVQELAAVAAERIPLPVVVFANGGYGEIRAQMRDAGISPVGVDLPVPDLVGLARSLGGHGVAPRDATDLATELAAAFERPGPTVLVVEEESA
jgi:thiamine pyrophosphate-dependent acetolactate synthase large subunit-like protein